MDAAGVLLQQADRVQEKIVAVRPLRVGDRGLTK